MWYNFFAACCQITVLVLVVCRARTAWFGVVNGAKDIPSYMRNLW